MFKMNTTTCPNRRTLCSNFNNMLPGTSYYMNMMQAFDMNLTERYQKGAAVDRRYVDLMGGRSSR